MDKEIKKELRDIKKRLEVLENRGPKGTRLVEISEWILDLFDDREQMSVRNIMIRGKKLGYSEQMIQRARRELLSDEVGYSVKKGEGWSWIKLDN